MAANVLHNYNRNPYDKAKEEHNIVLFAAKGYHANLLNMLSPIALRVLLTMAGKLNGEGYTVAPLDDLASLIRSPRSFVNKGILELAKYDVIRKKSRGHYWVNPSFFRPAMIEV